MAVLIIEDDEALAALLATELRTRGLPVDAAVDGLEALQLLQVRDYAVVLLDLSMPRFDGFQFLDALRQAAPRTRPVIVVMTGIDSTIVATLPASDVHAIVRKPFDVAQVATMVATIAASRSGQSRNPPGDAVSMRQQPGAERQHD